MCERVGIEELAIGTAQSSEGFSGGDSSGRSPGREASCVRGAGQAVLVCVRGRGRRVSPPFFPSPFSLVPGGSGEQRQGHAGGIGNCAGL